MTPLSFCVFSQVLASLRILLMMKPTVIHSVSRQIAFGLHDLLRTNAANIHSAHDWLTLFTLLEVVGAGTDPPPLMQSGSDVNVSESLCEAGNAIFSSDEYDSVFKCTKEYLRTVNISTEVTTPIP